MEEQGAPGGQATTCWQPVPPAQLSAVHATPSEQLTAWCEHPATEQRSAVHTSPSSHGSLQVPHPSEVTSAAQAADHWPVQQVGSWAHTQLAIA